MVVTTQRLASEEWQATDEFEPITYEKVVGINNLLNIAWLSRGLELAAAVARVVLPDGPGTGFLVGTDLLLTNHHVLATQTLAEQAVVEFNYQLNWAGELEPVRRFTLDGSYFRTNPDLDYTIVRVREHPGDLTGYVDLSKRSDASVNDFVSVIQHPLGGPKQICFTDNKVAAVFGNVLQYSTDTEPGSSGSPVFNQSWQIVGLHHKGGGLAGPDGKKYFTNEGIAINAILRDASSFLGLPDSLYDLAFGELRATLVNLIDAADPPRDPIPLAGELLRTRPRFSVTLDDWAKLNCKPGESAVEALAAAGVALGGALRQWARTSGHESIQAASMSTPSPSEGLAQLLGHYNGSEELPSVVYAAVLTALREQPALVGPLVERAGQDSGAAAAARSFLIGVTVGGKAFDGAGEAPAGSS